MRTLSDDTCDACGPSVRAAVLVRNIPMVSEDIDTGVRSFSLGGELTLCGHHADVYALTFTAASYVVHDYRLIHGGVAA